jgi:hypothetical protein
LKWNNSSISFKDSTWLSKYPPNNQASVSSLFLGFLVSRFLTSRVSI